LNVICAFSRIFFLILFETRIFTYSTYFFFFLIGLFVCLFFADILKYKLGVLVLARISHWDDLSQNWHSFP